MVYAIIQTSFQSALPYCSYLLKNLAGKVFSIAKPFFDNVPYLIFQAYKFYVKWKKPYLLIKGVTLCAPPSLVDQAPNE